MRGVGPSRSRLLRGGSVRGSWRGSGAVVWCHFCWYTVDKSGSNRPPRGAGPTIGLGEVDYCCGERRRPAAASLRARWTSQRARRKVQARPAFDSSPLPHRGGGAQNRYEFLF